MPNQRSYKLNSTRSFSGSGRDPRTLDTGGRTVVGKRWHAAFETRRDCYKKNIERPNKENTGAEVNSTDTSELLNDFLGDDEDAIPSWEARTVRRFFEEYHGQSPTWAWLDDREYASGRSRSLPATMGIETLRQALRRPRYGHAQLPDGDRRLIYVSELDPTFILALAEAAEHDEKNALQDAICKHIASVTALQVHVPMDGFITFRLEFHVSYLVMREQVSGGRAGSPIGTYVQQPSVVDISFLSRGQSLAALPEHTICQAQISIIVFGESNTQWTGYAFARTGLCSDSLLQTHHTDDSEDEPKADFFAADRDVDYVRDADSPTWDARTYWLQIVAIRCQLILKEWLYMVHTIEERVELLRANDPCSNSNGSVDLDPDDIRKSLQWTLQAMQLLRKLLDSLSTTLRAYERFNAPDGDKCYFSDMDIGLYKDGLKGIFEQLTDVHLKLVSLDDSCKRFATHLGRILDLESNVVARKSNVTQEQTQKLTENTIQLNTEIRALNEISSEAARANQIDAAKTSRSTRVNVELLLLTTPLGMVLQYFGSEKDIFSFTRNTKTFFFSILILTVVLRVLALLLEHTGKLISLLPWKLKFRSKTSISPEQGAS